MNVEQSMCAASGPEAQWERIDWSQCEQKVSRLQATAVCGGSCATAGHERALGVPCGEAATRHAALSTDAA